MATPLLHILLVEDDDIDAEVLLRSFQRQGGAQKITVTRNGLEALAVLRGQPGQTPLSPPYLIITDLNMPRMNGHELIQALRQDPQLRRSIIFVLSSSALDTDKVAAYDQHIAGYLLKSNLDEQVVRLWKLMESYQESVEFPPA